VRERKEWEDAREISEIKLEDRHISRFNLKMIFFNEKRTKF
jgi:hypothetical protein